MDPTLFLAFLTTTLFFVLVPGPSAAFAAAQAVRHGHRAACITIAGDGLGTVVHITIAASSLTALIALSDLILPPLQIIGGLFVLFMAYQSFAAAFRRQPETRIRAEKVSFWAGFFACVSNPKAIVFFVALFPAFISPDHNVLLQTLVYGAVFLILDAISLYVFALFALRAVEGARSRWLNAEVLSGLGLTGVGCAMVIKGYRALPNS